MNATVANFRGSKRTQNGNQMIILPEGCDTKEKASKLVGKTVVWESPAKKEIKGKITSPHGNKGAVRVHFEKGMPGQAIATKVKIE